MAKVDPEELEALTGGGRAASPAVSERDFARPMRLGTERLEALRQRVELGLPKLAAGLSDALGRAYRLRLGDVREVHADVVAQGLEEPLAALAFQVAGQPGWAVWEREAAVRAVETLLCGAPSRKTDRALSELETALIAAALQGLVAGLAERAGVTPAEAAPATTRAALGTWYAAGASADPHRVAIDLTLASGKEESEVVVYLPGLAPGREREPAPPAALPEHLAPVDVICSARLGETDVPLSELLALEEGDVIALGRGADLRLALCVDGWELARGVLGTSAGRLAVRLTEVHPNTEGPEPRASR